MSENEPTAASLKDQGNEAVKNKNYHEAVLKYTQAIKIEPKNHVLYSNRSFAFLKVNQYSLAFEDAITTIQLEPNWAKGYFRKAEVEYEICKYEDAMESYALALRLTPEDAHIYEKLQQASRCKARDKKADQQVPWVGAGIGIVIGAVLMVTDFTLAKVPTHPLLMAIVTVIIAFLGYGVGKGYRYYIRSQRNAMVDIPNLDLGEEEEVPMENGKAERTAPKYTKSQARQRYKKGKM